MSPGEIDWLDLETARFTIGRTVDGDDPTGEGPPRDVTVARFLPAAAPVSVGQFGHFVAQTGYRTTAEREDSGFVAVADRTLIPGASWRYPSGPDGRRSIETEPATQISWIDAAEYAQWASVEMLTEAQWERLGQAHPNHVGATWEWCSDFFDPLFHRDEQRVNPTGPPNGRERLAKQSLTTTTSRCGLLPDFGAADLGFRAAKPRR